MKVAPTELRHAPFRALAKNGKGSNDTEKHGVDFLFKHEGKLYGVQRKEIKDLVASVNDKRLAYEVNLMGELEQAILVVEGDVRWSLDGTLMVGGHSSLGRWTRERHLSLLMTVQARGIWMLNTGSTRETAFLIQAFQEWVKKGEHKSLDGTRQGARAMLPNESREHVIQRHILSGFPGMGPERAQRWIKHFGGTGLAWEFGVEEMMEVEGIGKKIAEGLMEAL